MNKKKAVNILFYGGITLALALWVGLELLPAKRLFIFGSWVHLFLRVVSIQTDAEKFMSKEAGFPMAYYRILWTAIILVVVGMGWYISGAVWIVSWYIAEAVGQKIKDYIRAKELMEARAK